jgi:hypothetical protein
MNSRIYIFLITFVFFFKIGVSQTNNQTKIEIEDFNSESQLYTNNFDLKMRIFNYLYSVDTKGRDITKLLPNISFQIEREEILTDTLSRIEKALYSLGGEVICIKKIDSLGNIHYYIAKSTNLNIVSKEGIMKRH